MTEMLRVFSDYSNPGEEVLNILLINWRVQSFSKFPYCYEFQVGCELNKIKTMLNQKIRNTFWHMRILIFQIFVKLFSFKFFDVFFISVKLLTGLILLLVFVQNSSIFTFPPAQSMISFMAFGAGRIDGVTWKCRP